MRYAQCLILFAELLFAVDKFVTPDKLPNVPKQSPPAVVPADEPVEPAARCNCGCGKTNCTCGRTATSCDDPVTFDETALRSVMEAKPEKVGPPEIWMFSPSWCPYCGPTADRLGKGDAGTRLVVKKHDAHFIPRGGYPCFYDPVAGKQWTGHPKDMGELRTTFGLKPQAQAGPEVGGISVGKVKGEQVRFIRQLLGKSGTLQLGNVEITHQAKSLTLKVPANFKLTWATDAAGILTVNAAPAPTVSWGVLHQEVTSAVIGDKQIDLSLPWAPDVSLDIDDDHHAMESTPRSPHWPAVRNAYIANHPECAACGATKGIEAHHVLSFHLHPDKELDPGNLIGLCRSGDDHHFHVGHDPDGPDGPLKPNWSESNPNVRADAAKLRKKLNLRSE